MPSWLVPSVFLVAAAVLAGYVKVQFDASLAQPAAAAGPGTARYAKAASPGARSATTTPPDDDVEGNGDVTPADLLRSEVADPATLAALNGGTGDNGGASPTGTLGSGGAAGAGTGAADVARPTATSGADLNGPAQPDVSAGLDRLRALGTAPSAQWVDPRSSQQPWSALGAKQGLLTFRGNPTRSWYGQGPVPEHPSVQWTVPIGCSLSEVGGVQKDWCGSGWTGQPAVFRSPTTRAWWLAVGGYNKAVNFFDPATGARVYAPFATGDIIKGSVTVDPDGYPLLYTGSRDNNFHIVALDRDQPTELWKLSAYDVKPAVWNDDWDGSSLIIGDYLFEGGENSWFYIVKLNRGYGPDGKVTIDPRVVFQTPGWDSELLAAIGDQDVSIESSVAISGNTVYFANSGGLIQGWDISGLAVGRAPTRVFRFWTGDDTDASVVVDKDGKLYVASEYQRNNQRARDVGQIMKLDPARPDNPLVWSVAARTQGVSGVWATPALYEDPRVGLSVLVATNEGAVLSLDATTGAEHWRIGLAGPLWSSPVVVDNTLIQGDCQGSVHAYDLLSAGAGAPPQQLWSVFLGGCVESTPAVWDGRIYVGTRMGSFYAIGDR